MRTPRPARRMLFSAKTFCAFLLAILLLMGSLASAAAAPAAPESGASVFIGGGECPFAEPVLCDGSVYYLPLRNALANLGVPDGGIVWNGGDESVQFVFDQKSYKLSIGSDKVEIDGAVSDLGAAAFLYSGNSRTYIPAKFVAEALYNDPAWSIAGKDGKLLAGVSLLAANSWAPSTKAALDRMIIANGVSSPGYDPEAKPYAVFDFDNTTSIFDVEEALLIYQLENLRFKIAPDKMFDVLTTEVPKDDFSESYANSEGKALNIDIVANDCQKDYAWLCENYKGLGYGGKMSLDEVKKAPQYKDFIVKVRFLYDAIGDAFDAAVSYPWVTYLFTGMTSKEVYDLAVESHDYWIAYAKFEKIKWVSPEDFETESGSVSVSYKTGINFMAEMQDLYAKLQKNGIEVYVCSASFIDVIEAAAYEPKFGLNVKKGNVYAMMLKKDEDGRYINAYDYDNYFQTQGPGKKKTIDKFIVPKHGGKGPVFVAGDSQGDYNMITEYDDMALGLIVNRIRKDDFKIISQMAADTIGQPDAKYVLQGRDENKGIFIPSESSILLGADEAKLLP